MSGPREGSAIRRLIAYFDPGRPGIARRMLRLAGGGCALLLLIGCLGLAATANRPQVRWFATHMLAQAGRDRMALGLVEGLARDVPGDWRYHRLHALMLRRLDRIEEHLAVYDTAVAEIPDNWWPYSHRCFYTALYEGPGEVLADCDRALDLNPDWLSLAYERRGIVRAMAGDREGAIADIESALDHLGSRDEAPRRQRELDELAQWLAALQAGEQPFDEPTVKRLRARYE